MNHLSTTHAPSTSTRFRHLGLALSVFYLLYNVTTLYSVSLYKLYPSKMHHLATSFDSVIPFIPAMIVPYSWSLILFVAGFFLVRTSTQLSLLSYRLILATIFACLIFYFYPARFSFNRVIPDDWTQFGYQFLQLVDKPFNQLPSLHVSYAILLGVSLWDVAKSKNGWVSVAYRLSLTGICTLIALSTVLTYQHNLLDMFGGAVLAVAVLMLSNRIRNALVIKHLALGSIGFLLIAIAGFYLASMSMIVSEVVENLAIIIALYWLISFTMLACAYQQAKPNRATRWFQKTSRGRLTAYTWMKFAPIIIIYNGMSFLGQWYFKVASKSQKYPLTPYAINDRVNVVASPRLTHTDINSHLTYWLFGCDSLERSRSLAPSPPSIHYQIIVVDVAAEISSHVHELEVAAKNIMNTPVHYLYLPLLDLQPLNDVLLKDYIDLFKRLEALTQSAETRAITTNNESQIANALITLINFHCVMGLSRSIGVQVLYLLYGGTLTVHNYQSWIEQHYPHAHLTDAYLPQSLVEAMANYKSVTYSTAP
ncbi:MULTISPECIES: phosphatase PAP2 family protein [unclassified Psychrobacter]|uniref:phosphatase PAP2 family protein n=1 Tax=unclassified Psychrobacter TaxID=196806 RepID=UPI0025B5144C|nr:MULTISPECIES: phosphatase PAP2 family protein [unclassified Psychrobacter]MDN3453287.1 phosphatase PAP2 family protein [Psychrobacter sp. APC 3350]MDN3503126.1 phosphatase PAP2 family protein [Psychrobacter sp. 5A.1]